MRLYIGGAYQGKLAYLRGSLPDCEIAFCREGNPALELSKPAICGLHLWVRAALEAGFSPCETLGRMLPALREKTILCDLLGGGIVPLSPEERRWREETGRALQLLSTAADEVTEFLAGVPRRILFRQHLLLLRHGMTEENRSHRYCGAGNPSLCPEGRRALSLKRYLPAERYFTSPSRRAEETLSILFGEVVHQVLLGLAECSFGEFEGHTHAELEGLPSYTAWCLDGTGNVPPPGGEARNEHAARVRAAAGELLALSGTAHRIAVITHGGSIVRLMESWFPGERDFYEWQPAHGEGWRVRLENGAPVSYARADGLSSPEWEESFKEGEPL